jgi:serine/threonine protein kinase
MYKEIRIHSQMNHPNIIQFFHLIEHEDKLYMLLEYAPNGDLYRYILEKEKFSERDACKIVAQVALALQYIHKKGVLHRDLKPENILLDANFMVKVSDFGWCGELKKLASKLGQKNARVTFCGTYEYMAPEVIKGDHQDEMVDVWSLGILLYELLHGKTPFRSGAPLEIQKNIIDGRFRIEKRLSEPAIDLLRRILRAKPQERLNVNEILEHEFLKVELV